MARGFVTSVLVRVILAFALMTGSTIAQEKPIFI